MVEITLSLSTKSINLQLFTLILYGVGVRYDVDIFKLTASAQSIYREVYVNTLFQTLIFFIIIISIIIDVVYY